MNWLNQFFRNSKNRNAIIALICSIVTVLVLVFNSFISRRFNEISVSLNQLEYMLKERQTAFNQTELFKDLYLSYTSASTEMDKLIFLELMKATNDSLTIYLLESISKYEREESLKNKAFEVLTYKETENIRKIKKATNANQLRIFTKPSQEAQAINRIISENKQSQNIPEKTKELSILTDKKNLELARAYYSINYFKEACILFNKIDYKNLPDSLVDRSSLLLAQKAYELHDYQRAARNFYLALSLEN